MKYIKNAKKRMSLYNMALTKYGIISQRWMLIEELGELLDAIAKLERKRIKIEDLMTELADASIMIEQISLYYGWDQFMQERERKLIRLNERLLKL